MNKKHKINLEDADEMFDIEHVFARSIGQGKMLKCVTTVFTSSGNSVTVFQVICKNTPFAASFGNFVEAAKIYNKL